MSTPFSGYAVYSAFTFCLDVVHSYFLLHKQKKEHKRIQIAQLEQYHNLQSSTVNSCC
jgi:hypothetical protein